MAVTQPDTVCEVLGLCEALMLGVTVPELQPEDDGLGVGVADPHVVLETDILLLCVPVAHCVPDALTDTLAEDDRDSDGVAVTHVDTDTVDDGVCDSVVVRDAV